jgi:hypothetical protein
VLAALRRWWNPDHEPVLLDEPLRSETLALLRKGDAIGAMRIVNRRSGIGLGATKRAVDHLASLEGPDAPR